MHAFKVFFLKYLCSCTCGFERKTWYFGCRTQPLPFWTEGMPLSWWWLEKDLQSADLRAVCLRGKVEFSVKGGKSHQWKICWCKTEIFKIPLLSNRFQFSLVTVLWGETKLNLKNLLLNEREILFCVSSPLYCVSITPWECSSTSFSLYLKSWQYWDSTTTCRRRYSAILWTFTQNLSYWIYSSCIYFTDANPDLLAQDLKFSFWCGG